MADFKILILLGVLCSIVVSSHGMGRIVGGQQTTIQERPYQASLQYHWPSTSHSCGASIISTTFLLTAAHCDPGTSISSYYARVGATAYNSGGQVLKVTSFVKHPQYNRITLDYDFAIVGFESGITITLGPNVAIVTLTAFADPVTGSNVTVSGWGIVRESDVNSPTNLREVELPVVSQDVCRETYENVTIRHMCLGGTEGGMLSACFGDSGGPVVQNGTQYAVVSGGSSCELPRIPRLYGRISTVREWILIITGV